MFKDSGHFAIRYGIAALSVSLAVAIRLLLDPFLGEQYIFSLILLAVLLTAWIGGFRPALVAVVLGGLGAEFFLLEPHRSFHLAEIQSYLGLFLYFITGLGVAALGGLMHAAEQALKATNAGLEARVCERTAALEALNEKLRNSEAYFRPMIEGASSHAIFTLDLAGHVRSWNSVAEKIKGYTPDEIIGKHFSCFYTEEDRARDLPSQALAQALAEGGFTSEGYRVRKDGSRYWANATITPYDDAKGQHVGFVKVTQDVSDRKQAEEARQAAEARLQNALRWSRTGGWELDLRALSAHRTPEHDHVFGYDAMLPEWTYAMFLEHVLPEDRDRVDRLFKEAIAHKTEWNFECRIRRADGAVRWIWAVGGQILDGDGCPRQMAGIVQDITDRKAVENELRAERDMFATIVSTVPVVICSFRRRRGGQWSFPFAGPEIREIYGFEAQDIVEDASGILERIHPEDQAHFLETLRTSGTSLAHWRAEYRVNHPRRGLIWVEAHAAPCPEPDGAILWHGYLGDITERKRAEKSLAERERMLQFVTGSVRAGLVVIGPEYQYLFANEAYGQIYGLDSKAIVGKTIAEVLPFAWSQIKPHLDRSLGGQPGQFEISLPPLPGTDRNRAFFAVYEPRLREDGTPTSVVVVTDISARKQVESALVDRERLLSVVTGTIQVGLVVVGPDYRYQFANAAYAEIFNLGSGDIVGRRVPDLLAVAWSQIQPRLDRALSGERVVYELTLPAQGDGHARHFSVTYEPRQDQSGIPSVVVVVVDITERKQADELTSRMSERVQLAARAAQLGIWDWDMVKNQLTWDDRMIELYGRTREDFPGAYETWLAGIHPDDRERCDRESQEAREGTLDYDSEFRVVWPDGTIKTLKAIGKVLRDGTGQPIRMLGVNVDITERKRAEEEALEREERFRQIAENIREVFWLNDPINGRILYVSPAYETVWGRRCEAIYENPGDWLDAIHPKDQGRVREAFAIQQQGGQYSVEYRVVRPDDSIRWILDRGFPIFDEAGRVYRVAGVAEDITERRLAEIASQQQQARLEGIVDSAMDGIITVGEDQRVLLINAAAERMFGWAAQDVLGERIERFMPERFRASHEGNVLDFGHTGVAARAMGRFGPISGLRANGEEFPIEASISQIQVDGQVLYTVTCRDVTERVHAVETQKKLETQLHQSQKMEAFGQLAGGVAHDFNNLLTIITGYSEWMLAALPLEGDMRNMITEIHRAAERAGALTRQLLAFSRQQVVEPKVLDLNAVVDGVGKMLRRLIGEDIQLATALSPSISLVKIDPGQIEQVIMNLAVNARDAMPRGGRLTIETARVEFDGAYVSTHSDATEGNYVMLAISDTGIGMTPEIRERIFEPFFTTKGIGKGTGLGLAVVHGIVKQSGGSVEVYSEPDKGTTFKIYLPVVRDDAEGPESNVRPHVPRGGETILLVEDEVGVRMVTVLALQGLGYTVLEAPNGEAALQLMAEHQGKVELLLSDVVMPEMSGRTLAETLLALHPELKVLFVSGYTDDAIVRHGVLQAEVAFLQKPFTLGALARKVREVLDDR